MDGKLEMEENYILYLGAKKNAIIKYKRYGGP